MLKRSIAAGFILLLAALMISMPLFSKFTISNGKTGELAYIDDISNVQEFYISFRHSVNRTPVNEYYKIRNNKFIVYKTTFYSYGAGMPEYEPGSKQKITIVEGLVHIDNIDRELNGFTVMVGTYADHHFNFGSKSIRLSRFVEPQSPAEFSIRKVSALDMLRLSLKGI